jgi:hypothetical protein
MLAVIDEPTIRGKGVQNILDRDLTVAWTNFGERWGP